MKLSSTILRCLANAATKKKKTLRSEINFTAGPFFFKLDHLVSLSDK